MSTILKHPITHWITIKLVISVLRLMPLKPHMIAMETTTPIKVTTMQTTLLVQVQMDKKLITNSLEPWQPVPTTTIITIIAPIRDHQIKISDHRVSFKYNITDCSCLIRENYFLQIRQTRDHKILKTSDHNSNNNMFNIIITIIIMTNKNSKPINQLQLTINNGNHKLLLVATGRLAKQLTMATTTTKLLEQQLELTKLQHTAWAAGNVMLIALIFAKNAATKKSVNQTNKFANSKSGSFLEISFSIISDDLVNCKIW